MDSAPNHVANFESTTLGRFPEMTERLDCAVIGAGAVGLAIARELARRGREVVVLEAAEAIGSETSSRNSEVIHAGLYYPPGSLKGRLCVRGKTLLYAYLDARGVEVRRCGKLLVATEPDEVPRLSEVIGKAAANGCTELEIIDADRAREMEPDLHCLKAIWSPTTGIFDSHGYMLALRGDLEAAGGMIAFVSPVTGGMATADGPLLRTGGADATEVLCRTVVNAAGLGAWAIAASLDGMPPDRVPPRYLCKGNYFQLTGRPPFERLIYPLPGSASLGCHYTRDLGGQGRFGPDAEWVDGISYTVDPARADSFYDSIRRYWPDLPDGALTPAYCGIRPKIQAPHEPAHDFMIQGPADHGVAGLVNLYGIESPGLTASPAIAEYAADLVAGEATA